MIFCVCECKKSRSDWISTCLVDLCLNWLCIVDCYWFPSVYSLREPEDTLVWLEFLFFFKCVLLFQYVVSLLVLFPCLAVTIGSSVSTHKCIYQGQNICRFRYLMANICSIAVQYRKTFFIFMSGLFFSTFLLKCECCSNHCCHWSIHKASDWTNSYVLFSIIWR